MRMTVNHAGHHSQAGGIDNLSALRRFEPNAYLGNFAVLDQYIRGSQGQCNYIKDARALNQNSGHVDLSLIFKMVEMIIP